MTLFEAIILGLFQGIAEFLPISSSGHLVLLEKIFGIKEGNLFFAVMLHFGTLISVFIVYFRDIINIVVEFFKLLKDVIKNKTIRLDNQYKVLAVMIIVGTIPTGLMGILLNDIFEKLFSSVKVVGFSLIITGILLWIVQKRSNGKKKAKDMSLIDALVIGTFQGFAITPGISRSGSTIVGALFRGLDKKLATKFSFLLSIPAILGASLLEFLDAISGKQLSFTLPIFIGVIISAISGVIAIKILIKMLEKGKLYYFSYYVWIVGILTIVLSFA